MTDPGRPRHPSMPVPPPPRTQAQPPAAVPRAPADVLPSSVRRVALVGHPNTGKTTLFNRLCGLRAKTANFPGSTVEARIGTRGRGGSSVEFVDLPGIYSLALDLPESRLCRAVLDGDHPDLVPDALVVVLDATNLRRGLQLAANVLRLGAPTVAALNMVDLAARRGISYDVSILAEALGCPVIALSARSGEGVDALVAALGAAAPGRTDLPVAPPRAAAAIIEQADAAAAPATPAAPSAPSAPSEPPAPALDAPGTALAPAEWADRVVRGSIGGERAVGDSHDTLTDRLDLAFTHPVLGVVTFVAVMGLLFTAIFWLADLPMGLIEGLFATLAGAVETRLPPGPVADLLANGVIAGVGGVLVFLPQICLLFFLLSLLEDTGYLARAAFVMDRVLCRFGLPGQAFVPLLSSHACALPGIMAARLIPDRHERLATILVAPFMSCSARIPVYVLLLGLLFPQRPFLAGVAFAGCYLLGAIAAMASAFLVRRTLLVGRARPMVLELPSYKLPSLRVALSTTLDRARLFLRSAGSVILAIGVIMWWLSAYPKSDPPPQAAALRAEAESAADPEAAAALRAEAGALERRTQQVGSFAGRIGGALEPVFAPLGADRQITVAILTSFLAREVFLNTMIVLVGVDGEAEGDRLLGGMRSAARDDGRPLFDPATCAGVLVFYVLAMQCLPTVALVRREMGSWRWAALQFAWMTALAWGAGVAVHALVAALT